MSERRATKANVVPVESRAGEALRTSVPARGVLHTLAGSQDIIWQLPEEVPLALQFNSQNHAVMMGTPADFEDFGIGFAIAEGIPVELLGGAAQSAAHTEDLLLVQLAGHSRIRVH